MFTLIELRVAPHFVPGSPHAAAHSRRPEPGWRSHYMRFLWLHPVRDYAACLSLLDRAQQASANDESLDAWPRAGEAGGPSSTTMILG